MEMKTRFFNIVIQILFVFFFVFFVCFVDQRQKALELINKYIDT